MRVSMFVVLVALVNDIIFLSRQFYFAALGIVHLHLRYITARRMNLGMEAANKVQWLPILCNSRRSSLRWANKQKLQHFNQQRRWDHPWLKKRVSYSDWKVSRHSSAVMKSCSCFNFSGLADLRLCASSSSRASCITAFTESKCCPFGLCAIPSRNFISSPSKEVLISWFG